MILSVRSSRRSVFFVKLSLKRSYLLLVLSKLFTFLFDSYTALLKVSYKVFKSYILRVKAFSGIIYNVADNPSFLDIANALLLPGIPIRSL